MTKNLKLIYDVLITHFDEPKDIYNNSNLLQYLEKKTKSISKDSKSRASFANIYAIYVLVEDYLKQNDYSKYDGMRFSEAFDRQRELPFGQKLQNHAFNHRCNMEYRKFFVNADDIIIRDANTKRYWINDKYLIVSFNNKTYNIAKVILEIIDKYIAAKLSQMEEYLNESEALTKSLESGNEDVIKFVMNQLKEKVDARMFEIVSFTILKFYYKPMRVTLNINGKFIDEELTLYKTGRTNANDGGIDFVLRPHGRFFQVTEELNFKKYFLDIDKLNKFPITFVIKTEMNKEKVLLKIRKDALNKYDNKHVEEYLKCFEEIFTINELKRIFKEVLQQDLLQEFLNEYKSQLQLEYNMTK